MFTASFDTESLATLVRMQGFGILLDANIAGALAQAGQLVVSAAQANTWEVFTHPSGQLAESIYFWVASPEEVQVTVGVPYGARREYGFSGKTDSLGRFYADDPGKPYLLPAVEANEETVLSLIAQGVEMAWATVGGA